MDDNGRFGFDPEDFDRVFRDASEGLREAFDGISRFFTLPVERAGWSGLLEDLARRTRTRPETAGEARVEEVYATELDALRANQGNTDAGRKVRFLPYGIAVSVLDGPEETSQPPDPGPERPE